MELKPGVRINGIRPELTVALMVTQIVLADRPMVVTSVTDGKHSRGSLHYAGSAFDLRTRDFGFSDTTLIRDKLSAALGGDFDVVLETDHLHIEYQPKEQY